MLSRIQEFLASHFAPKVAWSIEIDEGAEIVFARTREQAEKFGCGMFGVDSVNCRREPGYDKWARLKYVPKDLMLEDGWRFECDNCYAMIDSSHKTYDEDDKPHEINPVVALGGKLIFCCPACFKAYQEKRKERDMRQTMALYRLTSTYLGGREFWVQGGFDECPVYGSFKFPGGKGKADWSSEDPGHVMVQRRDVAAWAAFRVNDYR